MLILKILRELTVKLMHNKGFTLIELLVVIVIVAILSTIGIVYYGNFLKNSRDAKRQSDLKFIQSALEEYHADALSYPSQSNFVSPLTYNGKTYLTTIPNDPKNTQTYLYEIKDSGKNYCLYANLERTNVPNGDSACNPLPAGYNYGVTKP